MMHLNPAALSVSPKRPWGCCRDFRRCPMSLRLHRDGHHLRFGTGSHWYLFANNKHVCITQRVNVYINQHLPSNSNASEPLRRSYLSLNKGKANYLIKNNLHQPPVSGNFVTCDITTSHLAMLMSACTYNLHHSSLGHATDIIIIHQSFFTNPHDWYLNILVQHAQV